MEETARILYTRTGLTETIVAAAFSRIGLKILHLDRNEYYGGSYANFNLQGLIDLGQDLQESSYQSNEEVSKLLNKGETLITLPTKCSQVGDIKKEFLVRHKTAEEIEAAKALKANKNKRFNTRLLACHEEGSCASDAEGLTKEQTEKKDENLSNETTGIISNDEEVIISNDEEVIISNDEEVTNDNGCGLKDSGVSQDNTRIEEKSITEDSPLSVPRNLDENDKIEDYSNNFAQEEKYDDEIREKTKTEQSLESEVTADSNTKEWTVEDIEEEGRKFCLDLSPKVLYCCGELVQLLIQSDVARYCEFRTVSRVLTFLKGSLEQVPCSRADVFSSKIVSLIEKRLMMKFLQFTADYKSFPEEYKDYIDKPFHEFLSSKKLSVNVKHFVQNAIAMVTDTATTEEGLRKACKFLTSLGRYGNTAFLFPLYGSGELPQAFSRLSAVFGGTYCLKLTPTHLVNDEEKRCCGIITSSGHKIACRYLVMEASYMPSSFIQDQENRTTSRAILITDKSVFPSDDAELSLLNFICEDDKQRSVTVLELPFSASVCPKGLFVVHLTQDSLSKSDDVETDFTEVKDKLFGDDSDESKPKILWAMYFSQPNLSKVSLSKDAAENVLLTTGGGDNAVDLEEIVNEAKNIFHKVCPDEEFLAKPPSPEDIILVDDVETNVCNEMSDSDKVEEEQELNDSGVSFERSTPKKSENEESEESQREQ